MWQLWGYESLGEALSEVFSLKTVKDKTKHRKEPIKDKFSGDGHFRSVGVIYGHSSMQGWRQRMEDAHITVQLKNTLSRGMDIQNGVMNLKQEWDRPALFGVFDGHGGPQA